MYLFLMFISTILIAVLLTPSFPLESECEILSFSVVCHNVKGKFLPPNVSANVRSLVIVSSDMNALSAKDFLPFEKISLLIIDNCTFQIEKNIQLLSELKHLNSLTIKKSNVTEEVFALLDNHMRLCHLSLTGNKLRVIRKSHIDNLLHLCKIDISHNEISEIESDAFNDIPPVLELDLSHNRIGKDFDSSFLSLPALCTFCPTSPNTKKCPRDALKRCHSSAALDALWRKFGAEIIPDLSDNPLCAKLNHSIHVNRDEQDGVDIGSNLVDEEKTWNVIGKCSHHEERRKFLQRACNQDVENDGDEIPMGAIVQARDPLFCDHSVHHTGKKEKDWIKLVQGNQRSPSRDLSDSNHPAEPIQIETETIVTIVIGSVIFILCSLAATYKWNSVRKARDSSVNDDQETKPFVSSQSSPSDLLSSPQPSSPPTLPPPSPSPSRPLRTRSLESEPQKKY